MYRSPAQLAGFTRANPKAGWFFCRIHLLRSLEHMNELPKGTIELFRQFFYHLINTETFELNVTTKLSVNDHHALVVLMKEKEYWYPDEVSKKMVSFLNIQPIQPKDILEI